MTWRLHKTKPLWLLINDGVEIATLRWDRERNQYVNGSGIACGGSWTDAKASVEETAAKPKKVGR